MTKANDIIDQADLADKPHDILLEGVDMVLAKYGRPSFCRIGASRSTRRLSPGIRPTSS
jgi:hypothetical protein